MTIEVPRDRQGTFEPEIVEKHQTRFQGFDAEIISVHLDGCVEVEAAYYSAPPGWIGRRVRVQWDGVHVRLLDPRTCQLLREHLRQERGRHRIQEQDRAKRTPFGVVALLARASQMGENIGTFCTALYERQAARCSTRFIRRA